MATNEDLAPPAVTVEPADAAPVRRISSSDLKIVGDHLSKLFEQYRSDRRIAELKWLRNLRQYLGIYDPDVEKQFGANRSKAYPKITRVKCLSVLSRLMNLMFPGNEKNWELSASPSADIPPEEVMKLIQQMMQADQQAAGPQGMAQPPQAPDRETVRRAVQALADERARELEREIEDQLQEIGGDQSMDYIALVRSVVKSGILYGLGVMQGPFVKEGQVTVWDIDQQTGMPTANTITSYRPQYEFLPVWDFYPDMSAKTLEGGDGHFVRKVMSRAQLRKLADRPDFFADQVKGYLKQNPVGNYKAQSFETELRAMGVKVNVNEMKSESTKYEVLIWHGPLSGNFLKLAGVDVPPGKMADDLDAEVWMVANTVIKADINGWRKLGKDVRTVHTFLFDEDDTAPVGNGLPNVMRDSQMSIAAAARMLLDNASVVCGPNMELNTDLLRADQDLTSVGAYKLWYREGTGAEANMPAVRNVQIDSHMDELLKTIDLFMRFADQETFVGPATGGDMERKAPSEPMRTAAGASMLRGDAALPFKDIVRNFDTFTQSVIQSLVQFNAVFNVKVQPGDYNVIARGATSLIAKEVRGIQMDQLAVSLSPEEKAHVDERKFVEARFAVRDLQGLLVSEDEAKRRQEAGAAQARETADLQKQLMQAQIRDVLADAFKSIAQGQKNAANADAVAVKSALDILEKSLGGGDDQSQGSADAVAAAATATGRIAGSQGLQGMGGLAS
jgi:hypothetical protein